MNKIVLTFIFIFFVFCFSLEAAIHKGQKVFVKECVSCHSGGQTFVVKKTMRDWKKLMEQKGKPLAELHIKNKDAKDSWEYFESSSYEKKTKHLQEFLVEYAKDSGNVPACN
ncbi:MAG: cytochrome C [Sulfurimonas sp. GWF2_37_8]|nr:MAG: cytochrome C [Sulfurimonas sp. GWF2_37_8]